MLGTTATCGNCETILARNDKNDDELSNGISMKILHVSYTTGFSSLVQCILSIKQLAAVTVKTQKLVWEERKT